MMFHRLMWTNFVYHILDIRLYLSLYVNLTSHFSNFAEFRELQKPNTRTKYYEILPAHTKTSHDTSHKIANRYFKFNYHFLTLQKNPITFEQGCNTHVLIFKSLLQEKAYNIVPCNVVLAHNVMGIELCLGRVVLLIHWFDPMVRSMRYMTTPSHRNDSRATTLSSIHNGQHFPDGIFQCISWLKIFEFRIQFDSSLFLN